MDTSLNPRFYIPYSKTRSKRHTVILARPFRFDSSRQITDSPFLSNGSRQVIDTLLVRHGNSKQAPPSVHSETLLLACSEPGALGVIFQAAWEISQLLHEDEETTTNQCVNLEIYDEDQRKRDQAYSALVAALEQKTCSVMNSIGEGPLLDALREFHKRKGTDAFVFSGLYRVFFPGSLCQLEVTLSLCLRIWREGMMFYI